MNRTEAPPHAPRVGLWLLLGLLAVFGAFAHGYVENTDAEVTMHAARGFVQRGTFGLVADAPDGWAAERATVHYVTSSGQYGMRGVDGRIYVWFPIGHAWWMVPCVVVGDLVDRVAPSAAAALVDRKGEVFGTMFGARFVVSIVAAVAAAFAAWFAFRLARTLGAAPQDALAAVLVAVFATQVWPGASLTTSDGPGAMLLLLHAWLVARASRDGGIRDALLAGLAGGAAVLVRYPHALPVGVLGAWLALSTARRHGVRPMLTFVAGTIPFAIVLLATNHARFGDWAETGYSAGANETFFRYPVLQGIALILFAPGKGLVWFAMPLVVVVAAFAHALVRSDRRTAGFWACVPWIASLLALLFAVGRTGGWAAGQCYGIRYFTPIVLASITVGFAMLRPFERWPRVVRLVVVLGVVGAAGGVVTPYRGQQELAIPAAGVAYPEAPAHQWAELANFDPRFSPLHSHWTYAWLSATGRLAQGGAANTTLPMFGVAVDAPPRPSQFEDLGFRHWWPNYLGALTGAPRWPAVVLLLAFGGFALRRAWRAANHEPRESVVKPIDPIGR